MSGPGFAFVFGTQAVAAVVSGVMSGFVAYGVVRATKRNDRRHLELERQKDIEVAEATARRQDQLRAARDCEIALLQLPSDRLRRYWGRGPAASFGGGPDPLPDLIDEAKQVLLVDGALLPPPLIEQARSAIELLHDFPATLTAVETSELAGAKRDSLGNLPPSQRGVVYADRVGEWLAAFAEELRSWRSSGDTGSLPSTPTGQDLIDQGSAYAD